MLGPKIVDSSAGPQEGVKYWEGTHIGSHFCYLLKVLEGYSC